MKHYRINKLTTPDGVTVKTRDILAADDDEAVARAREDDDCPVCEVYQSGKKVGAIE